jgi:GT2 family glycosyltransferase
VVNGSHRTRYAPLDEKYPDFRFSVDSRPLGFTAAVRKGLEQITTGWTYLLNNDVSLDEDALAAVLGHRAADVFSLASRITMSKATSEKETNRTGIEFVDGLANLVELDGSTSAPVEHFYSGGGSSLFQSAWLRRFAARTICYDPFYWEDAEWGVLARSAGLRNIFVPESFVRHEGKVTVGRFFERSEVSRVFERNRIQFQLRCIRNCDLAVIRERLMHAPWQTLRELLQPLRLASMVRARASLHRMRMAPDLPAHR